MDPNERVKFIRHKGVRIFLVDASNLKETDEILAVIELSEKLSAIEPEKSILAVTDATNTHFEERVVQATKRAMKHNARYFKASAAVGVTGLKKALLPLVASFAGRKIKAFDTQEQAFDWLVTQAGD